MAVTTPNANRLRVHLCTQILDFIKTEHLEEGSHLTANGLATRFNVSRTPVRAALILLADKGILASDRNRGFFLKTRIKDTADIPEEFQQTDEERIYMAIAEDRMQGELADEISEVELIRRYDTTRGSLISILQRLAKEGLAYSKQGHGWVFSTVLNSREAYLQSYNYRKILEPASILEDSFAFNAKQAQTSRKEHQALLDQKSVTAADIFEVNAKFHSMLAGFSGNKFITEAIEQQNRLRRFVEYSYRWRENPETIKAVCSEHMAILDAIEAGNLKLASNQMWHHLDYAGRLQKDFSKGKVNEWAENVT